MQLTQLETVRLRGGLSAGQKYIRGLRNPRRACHTKEDELIREWAEAYNYPDNDYSDCSERLKIFALSVSKFRDAEKAIIVQRFVECMTLDAIAEHHNRVRGSITWIVAKFRSAAKQVNAQVEG